MELSKEEIMFLTASVASHLVDARGEKEISGLLSDEEIQVVEAMTRIFNSMPEGAGFDLQMSLFKKLIREWKQYGEV